MWHSKPIKSQMHNKHNCKYVLSLENYFYHCFNFFGFIIGYGNIQCIMKSLQQQKIIFRPRIKANHYIFLKIVLYTTKDTFNMDKTASPFPLYLCGYNWSLVFTTSAGWVKTEAKTPANAPQTNVSDDFNSGVPSSVGRGKWKHQLSLNKTTALKSLF